MNQPFLKYRYFVGLIGLEIPDPLGNGDQLGPFRITNEKSMVRKFMGRDLMAALGGLEGNALLDADAVVYCESTGEVDLSQAHSMDVLAEMLQQTGVFLTALWLVKDNAVNFERGFLEIWTATGEYRAHSNFLAMVVQKADGSKSKMQFSRSELHEARELFRNLMGPLSQLTAEEMPMATALPSGQQPILSSHANVPRLRRAFYFLESARSFRDMGMKIAMYCSLLETLFSTDASEVTHKIAHRIAIFLESETEKRCDIYNRIKKAYNIRSKVLHGDEVKQDGATILAISVDVDQISRRILLKIGSSKKLFDQFHASKKEMDEFFLKESFTSAAVTI